MSVPKAPLSLQVKFAGHPTLRTNGFTPSFNNEREYLKAVVWATWFMFIGTAGVGQILMSSEALLVCITKERLRVKILLSRPDSKRKIVSIVIVDIRFGPRRRVKVRSNIVTV